MSALRMSSKHAPGKAGSALRMSSKQARARESRERKAPARPLEERSTMQYEILGGNFPAVVCHLKAGESMRGFGGFCG